MTEIIKRPPPEVSACPHCGSGPVQGVCVECLRGDCDTLRFERDRHKTEVDAVWNVLSAEDQEHADGHVSAAVLKVCEERDNLKMALAFIWALADDKSSVHVEDVHSALIDNDINPDSLVGGK